MLIKHEIKDPENQKVLTTIILNLNSVTHAKMSPDGFVSVSLDSGVTYESESANAGSRMMAQLFWTYLSGACNPITNNYTEGNSAPVSAIIKGGIHEEKHQESSEKDGTKGPKNYRQGNKKS